ncbi:MAG: protein translocase subunit SecF [Candidatus Dormibacteraeota bacterium]|nr:protein translocase subunit SecF [Candidatus Dormibacteraeota bacterium]
MAELSRDAQTGRVLTADPEPEVKEAATPQPRVRRLDVVGRRNWFFALSLLIIIPGMFSMVTRGFLLGIDFAGGTEFLVKFEKQPSLQAVEATVARDNVSGVVQQAADGSFIIRASPLTPAQQQKVKDDLQKIGGPIAQYRADSVGPTVAQEIVTSALLAVVAAAVLILLYLAFRFRRVQGGWRSGFQFGGSALLALLHDVFLLAGIFSILGAYFHLRIGEIDSFFLTAVLTVVGFSVHDTIVVFDRIRENLIISSRLTFEQVVNLSIMQTAARSIITSFTVVIVLVALLLFGGETLKGFVLALLIGIISGTYSSIFNASPLLVVWRRLQPVR